MRLWLLPCFFLIFCLTSCSPFGIRDTYRLVLPELSESDQGSTGMWDISWLEPDGSVLNRRVDFDCKLELSLFREAPLIVSAQPVCEGGPYIIRPSGYLSRFPPAHVDELVLSWENGFASDYLLKIADFGISPNTVNIDRFREAVTKRIGDNPWLTDIDRLSRDLLAGDLWIYSFRIREGFAVPLSLPAGRWHTEYPPDPVLDADSSDLMVELPVGIHYFLRESDHLVACAEVNSKGEVLLLCF